VSGASCTKRLVVGALLAGACWLGAATAAGAQPNPSDDPEVAPSLRGTAGGSTGAGTAATERPGPLSSPAVLLPLVLVVGGAMTGAGVVLVRRAAAVPIGVNGQALEPAPAPVADAHSDVAGELGLHGGGAPARRRSGFHRSATTDDRLVPDAPARRSAGLVDLSGIDGVLGPRSPSGPAAAGAPPPVGSRTPMDGRARDQRPDGGPPAAGIRVDVSEPLFPEAPGGGREETGDPGASPADAAAAWSAGDLRWTRPHDLPGSRARSGELGATGTDIDTDREPADPAHHPAS
jgi:hypothetical protein